MSNVQMRSLGVLLVLSLCTSAVRAADYAVPERTTSNVVVAAYNIQWLGQKQHDVDKLAVVIEHFDVCGLLEVKDEAEVGELAEALDDRTGKDWGYVYGVRTHRPNGQYHEAYAAVWRRDRVQLGNGLVSNVWDLEEAYRNDPFVASFVREGFDFALLLVHTRWSDDIDGSREHEVEMLAEHINWLRSFLEERDLLLAGDFNYPADAAPITAMATAADLERIDPNAKSTFKQDYSGYANAYDHIYISESDTTEFIPGQSAVLNATDLVYGDMSKASMKKSKKELSDHLPVWAVFDVSGTDDDGG